MKYKLLLISFLLLSIKTFSQSTIQLDNSIFPLPTISSTATTRGQALEFFRFTIKDFGGDGLPTILTRLYLKNTKPTQNADWTNSIQGIILTANGLEINALQTTINDNYLQINIKPNTLIIPNNETQTIGISLYLNTQNIVDESIIQLMIDNTNHNCSTDVNSSTLSMTFDSKIISPPIKINVEATKLIFIKQPTVLDGVNTSFSVEIAPTDENGNVAKMNLTNLTLQKEKGNGTLLYSDIYTRSTASNYVFSSLKYDTADELILKAQCNEFQSVTSNSITVADANSMVEDFGNSNANIFISSLANTKIQAVDLLQFTITDKGTSDKIPTKINQMTFKNANPENSADWISTIAGVVLKRLNTDNQYDTIDIRSLIITNTFIRLSFDSTAINIQNADKQVFRLGIYLKENSLIDNSFLQLFIDADKHEFTTYTNSSLLSKVFDYEIVSSKMKILVKPSELHFSHQILLVEKGKSFQTSVKVSDKNLNFDTDAINELILNDLHKNLEKGNLTFDNLKIDSLGNHTFQIVDNEHVLKKDSLCIEVVNNIDTVSLKNWQNTKDFEVTTSTLKHSLSNVEGESSIYHKINDLDLNKHTIVWKFSIQNGDWNPSTSNYFLFYLLSDSTNFKNGYAVGNYGGKLSLFKIVEGKIARQIIESQYVWEENSYISITIVRSVGGEWKLFYELQNTDYQYFAGSTKDNDLKKMNYCGLYFKFTSTRAGKIQLDSLQISYGLSNKMDSSIFANRKGNIVITEIMADVLKGMQLPEYEYIELYNNDSKSIDLEGWKLKVNTTIITLPSYVLNPANYLIICTKDAENLFSKYGNCLGVTNFPTLINSRALITLQNPDNELISWVDYSDSWYESSYKKEGGWSLEKIDINNVCGGATNWKASTNEKGGTPAQKNSVSSSNPDLLAPVLENISVLGDSILKVSFNETLPNICQSTNYLIKELNLSPSRVETQSPQNQEVSLYFNTSFPSNQTFTLSLQNLCDCANLPLSETTKKFAIHSKTDTCDVIINEVLFNPFVSCTRFVELYNRSTKIIDLKELLLSNQDQELKTITNESYLLYPNDYVALSTDIENVKTKYYTMNPQNFVQISSMPYYPYDAGKVILTNFSGKIIDEFSYTDKMHYTLLSDNKGVSLERINPNLNQWHSAAETVGFATPAYRNSQYNNELTQNQTQYFKLESDIFSPDNDGYQDVLNLNYNFEKSGYTASILVFDSNGRKIKTLINNELMNINGVLTWDGTTDTQQIAPIGIYVIYIQVFDLEGNVKKYKETCVLTMKRN